MPKPKKDKSKSTGKKVVAALKEAVATQQQHEKNKSKKASKSFRRPPVVAANKRPGQARLPLFTGASSSGLSSSLISATPTTPDQPAAATATSAAPMQPHQSSSTASSSSSAAASTPSAHSNSTIKAASPHTTTTSTQPTSTLTNSTISSTAISSPSDQGQSSQQGSNLDTVLSKHSYAGSTLASPNVISTNPSSAATQRSARTPSETAPAGYASVIAGQKVIIPPLRIAAHKLADVTLKHHGTGPASVSTKPVGRVSHAHQQQAPPIVDSKGKTIKSLPAIETRRASGNTNSLQPPNHLNSTTRSSATSGVLAGGGAGGAAPSEQSGSGHDDYRILLSPMFAAMTKITDNLFLTGVGGMTRDNFARNHIDFVVNITTDAPFWEDIESLRIALEDDATTNMLPYLDFAVDKIHEAITQRNAHVLVHCVAGVSRSATVVIAYLMKYRRMDLRSAFNHCYHLRPVIRPNNGFMSQLMNYEIQLFGSSSTQMIQANIDGTIITVPNFFMDEHQRLVMLEVLRAREQQRHMEQQSQQHRQGPSSPPGSAKH